MEEELLQDMTLALRSVEMDCYEELNLVMMEIHKVKMGVQAFAL